MLIALLLLLIAMLLLLLGPQVLLLRSEPRFLDLGRAHRAHQLSTTHVAGPVASLQFMAANTPHGRPSLSLLLHRHSRLTRSKPESLVSSRSCFEDFTLVELLGVNTMNPYEPRSSPLRKFLTLMKIAWFSNTCPFTEFIEDN
ncbi:hypothetical protein J6590_056976 [Homalodisca vitripennis]|nr:hypothetical protein J6590_056976 [Homalodisca vitripennis]